MSWRRDDSDEGRMSNQVLRIRRAEGEGVAGQPMPDDLFLGMKVSEWLEMKSLMSAYGIRDSAGLRHALVRLDRISRAVKTIMEETNG